MSNQQQQQQQPQLTRGQHILLQKQQEHAGLQALREASAGLLERVEKLAEMSNVMADGGEGECFVKCLLSRFLDISSYRERGVC